MMFLGTHEPRLDEKGRLILPAKFRDELSAGLVITKGQERCLYVFPSSEFATITETLRQAPVTAKSARDYQRVMFAGAHDEIPDRQGRVTIPQGLRTYAGLEKEAQIRALKFGIALHGASTSQIAKRVLLMFLKKFFRDFSRASAKNIYKN
jgi:MraZ protein